MVNLRWSWFDYLDPATYVDACEVHLHPTDFAKLADTRFRSGTQLFADEGVPLGDVHVESTLGLLVRDTTDSLAAIEQRLLEDLG